MKWKIYFFDNLDSTNTQAAHYPVGSVIIAQNQTAGRGRNGRTWESLPGNLFLSAVLPTFGTDSPLLSFVAGVALAETFSPLPVQLKWPNDVLLNKAKLAGILLESTDDKIIAGFGVNIQATPIHQTLYPTTHLPETFSKEQVSENLLKNLSDNLNIFQEAGFEPVRQKWLSFAIGIGSEIVVRLPHETLYGIFESLTPQGAISLKTTTETRLITAGDIFLL